VKKKRKITIENRKKSYKTDLLKDVKWSMYILNVFSVPLNPSKSVKLPLKVFVHYGLSGTEEKSENLPLRALSKPENDPKRTRKQARKSEKPPVRL